MFKKGTLLKGTSLFRPLYKIPPPPDIPGADPGGDFEGVAIRILRSQKCSPEMHCQCLKVAP